MRQLTERQQIFCREYVTTLKGKESAVKAGYNESTIRVSNLLKQPHISAYIADLMRIKQQMAESEMLINGEFILSELLKTAKTTKNEMVRLKALELLGRHLGFFAKDNEQLKAQNLTVNINNLDIIAIAQRLEESC